MSAPMTNTIQKARFVHCEGFGAPCGHRNPPSCRPDRARRRPIGTLAIGTLAIGAMTLTPGVVDQDVDFERRNLRDVHAGRHVGFEGGQLGVLGGADLPLRWRRRRSDHLVQ